MAACPALSTDRGAELGEAFPGDEPKGRERAAGAALHMALKTQEGNILARTCS